jgi:hypothetical protein
MAIVPIKADGISSYGFHFVGAHGGLENWQCGFGLGLLFAGYPTFNFAFFYAGRARASSTQPCKCEMAAVAILPFNLDAGTIRLIDADVAGINGVARKLSMWTGRFARDIFRNNPDAFVAHTLVLHLCGLQRSFQKK